MATTNYLVPPQNFLTAEFQQIANDNELLQVYTSGNELNLIISGGYRLVYGFDKEISDSDVSGNWIYADIFDPNSLHLTRTNDFSFYLGSVNDLDAAATRFALADDVDFLTDADDIYDSDPAGLAIQTYRESVAEGTLSDTLFIDARGGVDTLYSDVWSSEDFSIVLKPNGHYQGTFVPTGRSSELRNFEKIDLADTPSMSLSEFIGYEPLSEEPADPEVIRADSTPSGDLIIIANVFGTPMFLDGLTETVTSTSHTIEYNGTTFDYAEVDGIITTVVRDGEFTGEFAAEIAESFPDSAGISYSTAVALIGQANMESTLLMVAGADGNYVG